MFKLSSIGSILALAGVVSLAPRLSAQTAELADRTGLESAWKRSGRTTEVIDYPFSPQPGLYGGKTVREWRNRGYIFINPEIDEFTRRRPGRPAGPREIPLEREDCREIREELLEEVARSEQSRQEKILLEQEKILLEEELRVLRERADDRALRIEALEFQIEELEQAAADPGPDGRSPEHLLDPVGLHPEQTGTYLVREGDSLWRIAGQPEVYNDPYRWLLLYHANRDQIFLPDLIYPGMVLLIPRYRELESHPFSPPMDRTSPALSSPAAEPSGAVFGELEINSPSEEK